MLDIALFVAVLEVLNAGMITVVTNIAVTPPITAIPIIHAIGESIPPSELRSRRCARAGSTCSAFTPSHSHALNIQVYAKIIISPPPLSLSTISIVED